MLRPPRSTPTYTLFPYTSLFRSALARRRERVSRPVGAAVSEPAADVRTEHQSRWRFDRLHARTAGALHRPVRADTADTRIALCRRLPTRASRLQPPATTAPLPPPARSPLSTPVHRHPPHPPPHQ